MKKAVEEKKKVVFKLELLEGNGKYKYRMKGTCSPHSYMALEWAKTMVVKTILAKEEVVIK